MGESEMRKRIIINKMLVCIFLGVFLSGCGAGKKINKDYLQADEWESETMREAVDVIKKDYLGDPETKMDREKQEQLKSIARESLLAAGMDSAYDLENVDIIQDAGMPETFEYHFIHFLPLETRLDLAGSSYLVVIGRLENRVLFSDVYHKPSGSSFYRYHDVLKVIGM